MAKTYSTGTGESESEQGAPIRADTSPAYAKFLPIIAGLLFLALVVGLVIRYQSNRSSATPGALNTSGAGQTGGAARMMEASPPPQSENGATGAQSIPPPGPKGAQATGK